jgi:hypothetical protein
MYNGAEIRAWIESSAKLIAALVAAGAVLAGSIIAANYESKLTSVNLLKSARGLREQNKILDVPDLSGTDNPLVKRRPSRSHTL